MINRVDITNFGSFKNFVWNDAIRDSGNNVAKFKKLNIIYGRNYSGKTTLSRIFRSLHTGTIPDKYENPEFLISTDSGTINQIQIPISNLHLRVYNRDFINEHLGFLRDSGGNISPFAVIGKENKAIEEEISEILRKLGSVEDKNGLRYEFFNRCADFTDKRIAKDNAEIELKLKLTNKATQLPNGIKHNSIYKDPNYNTPKIKIDIETIRRRSVGVFSERDRKDKEKLISEIALPDIQKKLAFTPEILDLYEMARRSLSKKISPTQPIQELLNDAVLQAWVKEGMPYHRDKRKACGFCGQALPSDLWKRLDEHFSKESADLEVELLKCIKTIELHKATVESIVTIDNEEFYSIFQSAFIEEKKALADEAAKYCEMLNLLIETLRLRINDIFSPLLIPELQDNSVAIIKRITTINSLVDLNNKKTETLETDQNKARTALRLNEIAQFIRDIDLAGEEKKISDLESIVISKKSEVDRLKTEIEALQTTIENLQVQLKDEKKGAEKVNEFLNNYFGHEGLKLEAVTDKETSKFKFQILRGDKPAYNLSEGECSLVSFCYFMAKLEDVDSRGKKLVIYIDDPVSSLDSNHVFFVYSLIESHIARPEEDDNGEELRDTNGNRVFRYEQFFISTHNLEFLKYLKRLSKPKNDNEYFLIFRNINSSKLAIMPSYLKKYITEFNYLFGEIYTCMDPMNEASQHHCFYNFGNNLRKFLEAYLFFKYPFMSGGNQDYKLRIKQFFKDKPSYDPLVSRMINEFSHLGESFDRGMLPIDCAEISKLAIFVMKRMKDNDKDQFECLLKSIDKPDPF